MRVKKIWSFFQERQQKFLERWQIPRSRSAAEVSARPPASPDGGSSPIVACAPSLAARIMGVVPSSICVLLVLFWLLMASIIIEA